VRRGDENASMVFACMQNNAMKRRKMERIIDLLGLCSAAKVVDCKSCIAVSASSFDIYSVL
jgi:hypothetical protein